VDVFRDEFFGSPNIIHVIRIATINENLAWLEQSDGFVHDCRRHHQPERSRPREIQVENVSLSGRGTHAVSQSDECVSGDAVNGTQSADAVSSQSGPVP
jgi:hypothetical protein